jgi:hypothetical protein
MAEQPPKNPAPSLSEEHTSRLMFSRWNSTHFGYIRIRFGYDRQAGADPRASRSSRS